MDLELSMEQRLLRDSARNFLAKHYSREMGREKIWSEKAFSLDVWNKVEELGWGGIAVPEKFGGSGLGMEELVVLFEEIGRACFISPLETTTLACMLLQREGISKRSEELLSMAAKQTKILSLAIEEQATWDEKSRINLVARRDKSGFRLRGAKLAAEYASVADYLICVAKEENGQIGVFAVKSNRPGVDCARIKSFGGEERYDVLFDDVEVPEEDKLRGGNSTLDDLREITLKGALLKAAEILGCLEVVLGMVTEYLGIREQFGRPLGSFQAVQHKCVEMLKEVDFLRGLVYRGACLSGQQDRSKGALVACSIAKCWANRATRRVLGSAHQLFGGIGFCEEHDLHLFTRRAKSCEMSWGDSVLHREHIVNELFEKSVDWDLWKLTSVYGATGNR